MNLLSSFQHNKTDMGGLHALRYGFDGYFNRFSFYKRIMLMRHLISLGLFSFDAYKTFPQF